MKTLAALLYQEKKIVLDEKRKFFCANSNSDVLVMEPVLVRLQTNLLSKRNMRAIMCRIF